MLPISLGSVVMAKDQCNTIKIVKVGDEKKIIKYSHFSLHKNNIFSTQINAGST